LPLHGDDEHFVTGLRLMGKDNQAEFDTQLVALTKILVDSINEKEITKDLQTLKENDKAITKLEKFFVKRDLGGFESYFYASFRTYGRNQLLVEKEAITTN
jgi:hypothetical protein